MRLPRPAGKVRPLGFAGLRWGKAHQASQLLSQCCQICIVQQEIPSEWSGPVHIGLRLHESFGTLFVVPSFAIAIALDPGGSGR